MYLVGVWSGGGGLTGTKGLRPWYRQALFFTTLII